MGSKEEEDSAGTSGPSSVGRKSYWRSQSWSAARSAVAVDGGSTADASEKSKCFRLGPPLTPSSQQNCKARSCLPPLQPLSIARRSVDEWPKAGSDDVGEWPQPPTPTARRDLAGEELRVDLSLSRSKGNRNQIAFFDKECSKVADHVYLGGDAVAKNREILGKNGITHVLNCVGFVCPEYFKADLVYRTLWLQDSPSEDITSILYDVFDYFEDVREQGGRVFVHCCQGVSRSTSLVIAYLMWRKGQSFEDAFDLVKAARGIANPNMGFACQLLQCQKRVHAIPLSPNTVLRMYRMAPHSPYDALHLVPKMLNEPSPMALDSRGAFIVHVLSSLYVWVGKNCKVVMEKDAKAAAYQVVRYERVPGPIYVVEEGDEPSEFWEAFQRVSLLSDPTFRINKEEFDFGMKIGVGWRNVEAYDADFELFYKGFAGGVMPPFSSEGAGHGTHLPTRENNWSTLRRKFISGGLKGWVPASKAETARDKDVYLNRAHHLSADPSTSPFHFSPSSLLSDSSNSTKSSVNSPSFSPLTNSPLMAASHASLPDSVSFLGPPNSKSKPEPFQSTKVPLHSFAECRRKFTLSLKLPTSIGTLKNESTISSAATEKGFLEDSNKTPSNCGSLDSENYTGQDLVGNLGNGSSEQCRIQAESSIVQCISSHSSSCCTVSGSHFPDPVHFLVYCWPELKKIEPFCHDALDSKAVYLILIPETCSGCTSDAKLYVWIGSHFVHPHRWAEANGSRDAAENKISDWKEVGFDFLNSMGLQKDIPIKVVQEEESITILELLNML